MDQIGRVTLDAGAELRTSWIYALSKSINLTPSLYLEAGAIHGCVLCERDRPLIYMEDVGRHNAIDKIAGYMHLNGISPAGKLFYTTGRLTSEMVIKTVQMRIRSEEHTSELQSLMRISYAVFCLKKKKTHTK